MTEIAAHRGGALLWPENSRLAFENTTGLAVEQVEFDVHFSADRRLVVIHDATLDRTTDGSGPVCEQDWEALSRLVVRGTGGQRPLLLDEVIAIFRPTPIALRIELKPGPGRVPYPGLPGAVIDTLRRTGMLERGILTSFQLPTLREADPAARRVWLVTPDVQTDVGIAGLCALATGAAVPTLGLRSNRLDAAIAAEVRAAGLGIGAWAVNDAATIARMLDLAVDAFTTDRPDLALALRARHAPGN
jgi:glycerophosphoryl diester phosphodiesterase